MKSLKPSEKEVIFDYFLGIATPDQQKHAQQLLAGDDRAGEFLVTLEQTLCPLDHYEIEQCPDHLAQRTIENLKRVKLSSEVRLAELLRSEQARPVTANRSFWRNISELAAAAAMIVVVAGLTFPTLQNARNKYWQTKCSAQLGSIAGGISQYTEDNKEMPRVAMADGSPWWKIGDQGDENVSNTRHLWLLVKNGYVVPEAFVCPARIEGKALKMDSGQARSLADFPARKYVAYSFRVVSSGSPIQMLRGEKILISDLNPVFEKLPDLCSMQMELKLCDELKTINSTSHKKRGQSVVYGDGHVKFESTRNVGIKGDDIFTIKNTETYRGCERPSSEDDEFLAP